MISILDRISPKWMGVSGAIVFSLGALIGFYGFPALIRSQIATNLALKKGSDIRTLWEKVPDPIDFKVYVFNVTNPQEVQRGQTPVLNEIGPFFYGEYKEKVNLVDQNKDDTVFFNPVDTWIFNKERSAGLTGDEMLTVPHAALLAMAITVEREKPAALKLLNKAIPYLFGQPSSVFVTAPARQILFEGLPIFCNATDFSAKAVCSEIRKQADSFQKLDENVFGFSFFGLKNGTAGGRFQVKRGIQNISEVGQVVSFNGKPKQTVWNGDQCNKYAGTDSTIFAPFLTQESKIVAFAPDLCRSIAASYEGTTTYRGIHGYRFTADFGDPSTDPELKCFCATPDTCPKKGIHDLLPCIGAPIMASLPHFYLADESYQRAVIGLRPNKDEHEITMQFEPMTATPLVAYKRLQFNIALHSIEKIDLMQEIPTILLPILWVQEGLELKQEYIDKVAAIFKIMSVVDVLKWIMMVLGGGLGAASAGLLQMKKSGDTVQNNLSSSKQNASGIAPLEVQTPNRY